MDEQITAQFLFLLSPARFCFSRSSRGSRGSRGSFGYLSKRVYTTLNLSSRPDSIESGLSTLSSWTQGGDKRLALEHMESDNPTTSEVINSLLFNQNISIRLRFPGVYFFAHIPSGMKYVGSSNSLSRRLSSYFNLHDVFYNRGTGLLVKTSRNKMYVTV